MSSFKDLAREFLTGGWIVAIIGALGMLARNMLDGVDRSFVVHIKRMVSAAICSTVLWFVLEQLQVGSLTKAISYGIIGVVSPELIRGITLLAKKFAEKPQKFLKNLW